MIFKNYFLTSQSRIGTALKNKGGFTLIELLVVISILAILTALLLPNLVGIRERGRDSRRKSELRELSSALRLYYNDYQSYPASSSDTIMGCGADGDAACSVGNSFVAGGNTYMQEVPEYTGYAQTDSGEGFDLWVTLENGSDQDIGESQSRCGVSGGGATDFYVCAN